MAITLSHVAAKSPSEANGLKVGPFELVEDFKSETPTSSSSPIFAREDAFGPAHIHNYLNGIANGECLECACQIRRAMAIWYSASGGERASIFNLWLAMSNRKCLLYVEISNEVSFRTRIAGRPHCSNRKLPLKIISMKMHRTEEGESACSPFHCTANVLPCPPVSRPVKVFAPDLDWKAPTIVIERRRRHCRRPPTLLLLRHACVACGDADLYTSEYCTTFKI